MSIFPRSPKARTMKLNIVGKNVVIGPVRTCRPLRTSFPADRMVMLANRSFSISFAVWPFESLRITGAALEISYEAQRNIEER